MPCGLPRSAYKASVKTLDALDCIREFLRVFLIYLFIYFLKESRTIPPLAPSENLTYIRAHFKCSTVAILEPEDPIHITSSTVAVLEPTDPKNTLKEGLFDYVRNNISHICL